MRKAVIRIVSPFPDRSLALGKLMESRIEALCLGECQRVLHEDRHEEFRCSECRSPVDQCNVYGDLSYERGLYHTLFDALETNVIIDTTSYVDRDAKFMSGNVMLFVVVLWSHKFFSMNAPYSADKRAISEGFYEKVSDVFMKKDRVAKGEYELMTYDITSRRHDLQSIVDDMIDRLNGRVALAADTKPGSVRHVVSPVSDHDFRQNAVHENSAHIHSSVPRAVGDTFSTHKKGPLKLGILTHDLRLGGAERWIAALVKYLDPHRIKLTGVALTEAKHYEHALLEEISERTPVSAVRSGGEDNLLRGRTYIAQEYDSKDRLTADLAAKSDILLTWGSGQLMRHIKNDAVKVVLASHAAFDLPNLFLDRADALVGCSLSALGPFFRKVRQPLPTQVIYNGADPDRVRPIHGRQWQRRQWSLADDDIVVGFLSRQSSEKNFECLADAIERMPGNFKAMYYGQDQNNPGDFAPALKNRDRIHLNLPVPHLGDVLAGMDVLAVPTHHEAFSFTIIEAWLAGVPVIATPLGNEPETVLRFGSMVTTVPFDVTPVELEHAIYKALDDPAKEKARKAQEIAKQHFTCQTMAENWANFLETLV